ncbi:MAG: hypothetical protein ACK4RK_08660 [Gemmataceae bacterium]
MSRYRTFTLLGLILAALTLLGLCVQRWRLTAHPSEMGTVIAEEHPRAEQALRRALTALEPARLPWLRHEVHQCVQAKGLNFTAEGAYARGPDYRLRLDLRVRSHGTSARLAMWCDGRILWRVDQAGSAPPALATMELVQLRDTPSAPSGQTPPPETFFHSHLYAGIVPLLHDLRQQLVFIDCEADQWQERAVWALTGIWKTPPSEPAWLGFTPRCCRLFLDEQTYWPYRVEWWGPLTPATADVLLMWMEFRDPVPGRPLPDHFFTYHPDDYALTAPIPHPPLTP